KSRRQVHAERQDDAGREQLTDDPRRVRAGLVRIAHPYASAWRRDRWRKPRGRRVGANASHLPQAGRSVGLLVRGHWNVDQSGCRGGEITFKGFNGSRVQGFKGSVQGFTNSRFSLEGRNWKQESAEQEIGQQQGPQHVESLTAEKRQRGPAGLRVDDVRESGFEPDGGKCQSKPPRSQTGEQVLRLVDQSGWKQKRKHEGSGDEPEHELGKSLPDDGRAGAL